MIKWVDTGHGQSMGIRGHKFWLELFHEGDDFRSILMYQNN